MWKWGKERERERDGTTKPGGRVGREEMEDHGETRVKSTSRGFLFNAMRWIKVQTNYMAHAGIWYYPTKSG